MRTLRPAVNDNDSTISKIIKYIPGEIIAVYTAIVGVLKPPVNLGPTDLDVNRYMYVLFFLIIVTPIWTFIAVISNGEIVAEPPSKRKRAFFHATIATFSFVIWVYALGDILFRTLLCNDCHFKPSSNPVEQAANFKLFNECLNSCSKYDSKLGAIVLILFTSILVPLLEFLFLKKPVPPQENKQHIKVN